MEEVDEIARRPYSIPISCYHKLNFDGLLARIWEMMVGARCARCGLLPPEATSAGASPPGARCIGCGAPEGTPPALCLGR